MSAEISVYRSKHPDVWAAVRKYQADCEKRHKQIEALRRKFKLGKTRAAYLSTGFGSSGLAGFGLLDGEWRNPPDGWRVNNRRGGYMMLVPYKTKAKANPDLVKAWGAIISVADYRYTYPGMPAHTGMFRSPGCHPDKAETYLYVDWGDGHGPKAEDVDLAYWEPLKRSEYHALKEAGEFVDEADQ